MKKVKLSPLVISLILPFLAGGIGSYFTFPAIDTWYLTLHKPFFNPPNWVFGPAWTLLYISMGISLYIYWTSSVNRHARNNGLTIYFIQLGLNTVWSIAFFGLRSPIMAFLIIISLWVMIYLTIQQFIKYSITAGQFLIPYLLWVSFAALLNLSIILLN